MRRSKPLELAIVLASVLSYAVPATYAQQKKPGAPYALIFGTVYGPDDKPVYGVPIKVRSAHEKRARWELMSDHSGEFAVRVPPGPGDYVVWADLKSLKKDKKAADKGADPGRSEVKVHVDNEERVDIGLHLIP